jgi:hypothetical protein
MGLLDTLRKLGDRLGILELSREAQQSAPVKIQTRSTTLAELIVEIQVTDVQSLAELPAELSVSFEDVFKAAGIPAPPSGWTVERLMEFVQTYKLHSLEHPAAQRAILSELKSQNVDAADVIKDAISRDQALDAFAESVLEKRKRWLNAKKKEIQAIEDQIAEEEEEWSDWRRKKREREQEMARAVEYLIDKPVISIDDE